MQTDLYKTEAYPIEKLPYDQSLLDYGPIFSKTEAETFFVRLQNEVPWQNDTVIIFGRQIVTKRQVAWFATGSFNYRYSGTDRQAQPMTPLLNELSAKLTQVCGYSYNSVLLNLYHDGSEGMGWHSDDEKELGDSPNIASLSFGATRRFDFRHKETGETIKLSLESGQLIVMKNESQSRWKHQLPKQLRVKEPRINLTFRNYLDCSSCK